MSTSDESETLPGLLRHAAVSAAPNAGVITPDERASWGRVLGGAEALATRLAAHGVAAGERVAVLAGNGVAGIELRAGATAGAEDLQEHCAGTLASFKLPSHIRFVTEWPMSATKIQKGPLRERIADELCGRT